MLNKPYSYLFHLSICFIMPGPVNIMWFRRDLRLEDNAALYHALKSKHPVIPVFIFDKLILDPLPDKADRRVEFIQQAVVKMQAQLVQMKSSMEVFYDTPMGAFEQLINKYTIEKVFINIDYEPYATERDAAIATLLAAHKASLYSYKDQVILDRNEVLKDDGKPYTVFTPYSRRWNAVVTDFHLKLYPAKKYYSNFFKQAEQQVPTLESMGFTAVGEPFPSAEINADVIRNYIEHRNFPADPQSTTQFSIHLRFGTISIRKLATYAKESNTGFLNELVWRDFYQMILWHFQYVGKGKAFKPAYDHIEWRHDEAQFEAWCQGKTGYPLVDAGMRQLNATGFMHNRVRMVTASFLVKHLLIDWRLGEAYFAAKLNDFDLASNNGGWQWAVGSGCDASPYFRVFNPTLQAKKFDPDRKYIRKWVPEFETLNYARPIVDHEFARKRAIEVYKKGLKQEG